MSSTANISAQTRSFDRKALKQAFESVKWQFQGKIVNVVGNLVEAILPGSQMGTIVEIKIPGRHDQVIAEVVGFKDDRVLLLPFNHLAGVAPGFVVNRLASYNRIAVGDFLLGRVVDPFLNTLIGDPLDIPEEAPHADIEMPPPNPMERERIETPQSLGIRAMDSVLTFGRGQRIGVMAGSGVGKSVLMGMIARSSEADINVIALIGERGREVREFIERDLGPEGIARSVIVAVTGDQSPLMRIRGAKVATAIAEFFSRTGLNVMFMCDSLTRVAMAQREIGNAVGEPPTTKGYTPSVFSLLPKLLERTGPQREGHGAISGIYTVLVDGDDFNDPVADAARSILDGHINLSRDLAAKGHFPAIEIATSASRVMHDIVPKQHWQLALRLRSILGIYQENADLIQIGAYQHGSNPKLDEAISLMPLIERFLQQDMNETCGLQQAVQQLQQTLSGQPISRARA